MATFLRYQGDVPRVPGVVVAVLGSFVLYLLTLSRNYAADALDYVLFVESDSLRLLVDIYHLLLAPLGWLFFRAWQLMGWQESAMLPLQVLNAAGGALSVGLLFVLAHQLTQARSVAALVAAGFALSGAQWLLSTEAEFVTIPLAASLLVLWVLLSTSREALATRRIAFVTGALFAVAVLTYASAIFLAPVVAIVFWQAFPETPQLARRQTAMVVLLGLAVAAIPYLLLLALPQLGLSGMLWSLTGGSSYAEVQLWDLVHGAYALLRALLLFPTIGLNSSSAEFLEASSDAVRAAFGIYYLLTAVLFSLPLATLWRRRRDLPKQQQSALPALLTWGFLNTLFALVWVPGDLTFWLPVLAVWWLLLAALLSTFELQTRRWQAGSLFFVLVIGLINGGSLIVPKVDASRNEFLTVAAVVREHTSPADLLLIDPYDDWQLYYYLSSFAQRQVAFIGSEAGEAPWETEQQWERIFFVGGKTEALVTGARLPPGTGFVPADWSTPSQPVWHVQQP